MSEAKWRVMVDWSGDGEFSGADDDVTGATLGLSLRHMRDLKTEHIDAARLDVRLANSTHKYSPPNGASALHGKLKPGRKVWLSAAFPCDEFGSTSGASLANRAPEYGAAYRWSATQPGFRIAANGGAQVDGTGAGRRLATMDFGIADASFGCEFTRGSEAATHGGLTLRYSDTNNFLYARVMSDKMQVRKVEDGADTLLAAATLKWDAGDKRFLQVVLHGEVIRVFVERRQVLSARSSFNASATRHGLYCAGAASHLWQRFGGWVSLFYGDLHSIDPQPGEKKKAVPHTRLRRDAPP